MPPGLHRTTWSKPHGACSHEVCAGRSKDNDKTMNVVARRPGSRLVTSLSIHVEVQSICHGRGAFFSISLACAGGVWPRESIAGSR